jgi:hypothetical protein
MAKKFVLHKTNSSLEITIGKIWTNTQRYGIISLVCFFLAVGITYIFLLDIQALLDGQGLMFKIMLLAGICIPFVFAYYLLKQLFYSETIRASNSQIEIIRQYIFSQKKIDVPLVDVTGITLAENNLPKTEHPLAKNTGDVFGFGANESAIAYINDEGKIAIVCGIDQPIICGKGLPFWDAEEVIKELGVFCDKPFYESDDEVMDVGDVVEG